MSLFGRQVIVQFGPAGAQGRSFTGLRVSFKITMGKSGTPNTGVVTLYNASADSIALLQTAGAEVRVSAGYDTPRVIFVGNPIKNGIKVVRQGPDRLVEVTAHDGGSAYGSARVDVSFATETTLQQVFDEVARQLAYPQGTLRAVSDVRFPGGCHFAGKASDVLDRIARNTGNEWFVRDGVLQFIAAGGDTGERAVEFSVVRGNLIGSPTRTDKGVELTALLEPSIRPGRVFSLQSEQFSGFFVAHDVEFVGDTHDKPFYVKVTGHARTGASGTATDTKATQTYTAAQWGAIPGSVQTFLLANNHVVVDGETLS